MVIDLGILQQGLFQFFAVVEPAGFDGFGGPAIEAFDHAIGLRAPGRIETVFDAMALTDAVEDVTAGGIALNGSAEKISKLLIPSMVFAPPGPATQSKSTRGGFVLACR